MIASDSKIGCQPQVKLLLLLLQSVVSAVGDCKYHLNRR